MQEVKNCTVVNEVATALFMSAPLLGVDKELKNNVPPPRATSGMPFFRWDFN